MGKDTSKYTGCLLGLAVGDAMGYTVDEMTWDEIRENYGPNGILGFDLQNDYAEVTSYTQVAAFVANGLLLGITRGTKRAHVARAVLESIAFQVTDLMRAMQSDAGCSITTLRVDGGASVSDLLMQMQADLLRIGVDRPAMVETTAFGAAALAGLSCGMWQSLEELSALRRSQHVFLPRRRKEDCEAEYALWQRAVGRAGDWVQH